MRIAVLLEYDRAIALAKGARTAPTVVPFDPGNPGPCIAALRAAFGGTPTIRLAIGLAFLEPANPELPSVSPETRQQLLSLGTDRWFPAVGASGAVALAGDGPLAFATEPARLTSWLAAFEQWASIELVEPAPNAIARTARAAESGDVLVAAAPTETGVLRFAGGRLQLARRLPPGASPSSSARDWRDASHDADALRCLLSAGDVPGHGQLLPTAARRTLVRRRRLGVLFAWGALAAAGCFAALSAERWRERTLGAIDAAITSEQKAADAALAQRARLNTLREESALVSQMLHDRSQPSPVLAALARQLPRDVVLTAVRADSTVWEVSGAARDASGVVSALAADSTFVDVRAVGGTNRYQGPRGTEESFAVVFRVRGGRAPR